MKYTLGSGKSPEMESKGNNNRVSRAELRYAIQEHLSLQAIILPLGISRAHVGERVTNGCPRALTAANRAREYGTSSALVVPFLNTTRAGEVCMELT